MRFFLLFVLSANLFLLSSCKKYSSAGEAFFIKAGTVSVHTDNITQGSSSQKITDLWLYVNSQFQGVYPVGHLMPIVSNGDPVRINLLAGIKNNGIADTRIFWPFYELLQFDTIVESGKTIQRNFTFSYLAGTTFTWMENFDGTASTLVKSAVSEVNYSAAPAAETFEGGSLLLTVASGQVIGQLESAGNGFSLPKGSSNVYLELNYKCNHQFEVGLIGDFGVLKNAIFINPQENWNKIYIQLSSVVSTPPTSDKYKVYFRMVKEAGDPDASMYLDNIKLVYIP